MQNILVNSLLGTASARRYHASYLKCARSDTLSVVRFTRNFPNIRSSVQIQPVFVLATGWRCGSTLLQRMIMNNDDIIIWGEPYANSSIIQTLYSQLSPFSSFWPNPDWFIQHHEVSSLASDWIANLYPSVDRLLAAHLQFFDEIFNKSAIAMGKKIWGIKEVRLNIDHAFYLKWLFPKAKFIFLTRDPFDAFQSYCGMGRKSYWNWPDKPIHTPWRFGRMWRKLAMQFWECHKNLDGIFVRYEDLQSKEVQNNISRYVGWQVSNPTELLIRGASKKVKTPLVDKMIIKYAVGDSISKLDYSIL